MCKINETLNYKGVEYKRISKTKLKNMVLKNELLNKNPKSIDLYVIPCKAYIFSPWIEFLRGTIKGIVELKKWLNEVTYYNCNKEMGNYLHYYIRA